MNAGLRTIEWLYKEQLRVDDEWSVRTSNGFTWWADKHAQTIEILREEEDPDGNVGYLISIRTAMLRALEMNEREIGLINALVTPLASMAGPVYDWDAQTLTLCSLVRVYDGVGGWVNPYISLASTLQIGEVRMNAPSLAVMLEAEEAISGPLGRGVRSHPDELADIITNLIQPLGVQPSQWQPAELEEAVDSHMKRPPALFASAGGAQLTVEFPYGERSSLCEFRSNESHPHFGNGLFILQSFPVAVGSELEGMELALEMNQAELLEGPFGYGTGSYHYRDDTLHFNCFLPNVIYRPGLVPNLYYSCGLRAREMSLRLLGEDWSEASFTSRRSALRRMIDRIRRR